MLIEDEKSGVPRSSDRTKGSGDAKEESRGHSELTSTKKHKGDTEFPRTCQLL